MSDNSAIVPTENDMPISDETTRAIVQLQSKELEVRLQELEQRKIEDQHSFEYAQKTLEAQKADRSEERQRQSQNQKRTYIFWCVVLVTTLLFFGYALYIGQGALVGNIVEKIVYYVAGALSSYGYCKYKQMQ